MIRELNHYPPKGGMLKKKPNWIAIIITWIVVLIITLLLLYTIPESIPLFQEKLWDWIPKISAIISWVVGLMISWKKLKYREREVIAKEESANAQTKIAEAEETKAEALTDISEAIKQKQGKFSIHSFKKIVNTDVCFNFDIENNNDIPTTIEYTHIIRDNSGNEVYPTELWKDILPEKVGEISAKDKRPSKIMIHPFLIKGTYTIIINIKCEEFHLKTIIPPISFEITEENENKQRQGRRGARLSGSKKDNENQKIESVYEPLRDYLQDDYMKDLVKAYSCHILDRDPHFLGGLYHIILNLDNIQYLKEGNIINEFQTILKEKRLVLSDNAILSEPYVNEWEIEDGKNLYSFNVTDGDIVIYKRYLKLSRKRNEFLKKDLLSHENSEDERLLTDIDDLIKKQNLMETDRINGRRLNNDYTMFVLSKIKMKIKNPSLEYGVRFEEDVG